MKKYEILAPMVVPRSAVQVAQDDEFILFGITTFKKTSAEFLQKCREQKWNPRQYKYVEGGKEEEQEELNRVTREERKVWGEALRTSRTGWSESVMIWLHVLTLRVFVEAVLRYGLPLEYITALVKVSLVSRSLDQAWQLITPRQLPRKSKRSKLHWTYNILTSAATHWAKINGARSPRTKHI